MTWILPLVEITETFQFHVIFSKMQFISSTRTFSLDESEEKKILITWPLNNVKRKSSNEINLELLLDGDDDDVAVDAPDVRTTCCCCSWHSVESTVQNGSLWNPLPKMGFCGIHCPKWFFLESTGQNGT